MRLLILISIFLALAYNFDNCKGFPSPKIAQKKIFGKPFIQGHFKTKYGLKFPHIFFKGKQRYDKNSKDPISKYRLPRSAHYYSYGTHPIVYDNPFIYRLIPPCWYIPWNQTQYPNTPIPNPQPTTTDLPEVTTIIGNDDAPATVLPLDRTSSSLSPPGFPSTGNPKDVGINDFLPKTNNIYYDSPYKFSMNTDTEHFTRVETSEGLGNVQGPLFSYNVGLHDQSYNIARPGRGFEATGGLSVPSGLTADQLHFGQRLNNFQTYGYVTPNTNTGIVESKSVVSPGLNVEQLEFGQRINNGYVTSNSDTGFVGTTTAPIYTNTQNPNERTSYAGFFNNNHYGQAK